MSISVGTVAAVLTGTGIVGAGALVTTQALAQTTAPAGVDWTPILVTLVGGASIVGALISYLDKRHSRKLREAKDIREAVALDVRSQREAAVIETKEKREIEARVRLEASSTTVALYGKLEAAYVSQQVAMGKLQTEVSLVRQQKHDIAALVNPLHLENESLKSELARHKLQVRANYNHYLVWRSLAEQRGATEADAKTLRECKGHDCSKDKGPVPLQGTKPKTIKKKGKTHA